MSNPSPLKDETIDRLRAEVSGLTKALKEATSNTVFYDAEGNFRSPAEIQKRALRVRANWLGGKP